MNADGRGRANLTNTGALAERDPCFSPDGSRIAFERETSYNRDIWRMNGKNKVNPTNDPAIDANPYW